MISYTFKIELKGWTASIQIPTSASLESLADAIIISADFVMDHAFGFYDNLKNPYRSKEEYTLFADIGEEVKPGDTGVQTTSIASVFNPGKKMIFLFDYGDDWMFTVSCVSEQEGRAFKVPKILGTTGNPPEQYPNDDE